MMETWTWEGVRTVPCIGTKEPVAVESDGHFLNLLAITSHILHHIGQIVGEPLPRFRFSCRCSVTKVARLTTPLSPLSTRYNSHHSSRYLQERRRPSSDEMGEAHVIQEDSDLLGHECEKCTCLSYVVDTCHMEGSRTSQ